MSNSRTFNMSAKVAALLRYVDCPKCGEGPLSDIGVEWDHINPFALSGDSSSENCMPLCPKCHSLKTNGRKHLGEGDKYDISRTTRLANGGKTPSKRKIRNGKPNWAKRPLQSRRFQKRTKTEAQA